MISSLDANAKTEKQKMLDEEYFYALEKGLVADRAKAKEICFDYNQLRPSDKEKRSEIIKKLFKQTGKNFHIESIFIAIMDITFQSAKIFIQITI